MKQLLLPNAEYAGDPVSIEAESTGLGNFQVLPTWDYGIQSVSPVTKPMTIQRKMETSKRGVVRILRKVEIPYSALFPSDTATGDSNLKISASRSKGSISCHVVLTLPKECVEDFKAQVAGSAGRVMAERQIAMVMALCYGGTPIGDLPFINTDKGTILDNVLFVNSDTWTTNNSGREAEIMSQLDRALAGFDWSDSVPLCDLTHTMS